MRSIPENAISIVKPKFIRKSMRLALLVANDNDSCPARKVGTIITDRDGLLVSCGYNSPPRNLPHCGEKWYIDNVLFPRLSKEEQDKFTELSKNLRCSEICPRKVLGLKSGERSELCSCAHSEKNSIVHAKRSLDGCILFCSCPNLSCQDCTSMIINSGIAECHFIEGEEYHKGCILQYEKVGIPVFLHNEDSFSL